MTPVTSSAGTFRQRLRSAWTAWDTFWCRECPPHLLAAFRIIFGAFLLFYWALKIPYVAMFFSDQGIHQPAIWPLAPLGFLFAPPPLWAAWILYGSLLFSLFCFTLGAWTRGSAIIAFVLYAYYWILTLHQFGTSFDRLFLFTMLVLCFSGCGETFSLDMRLRRGSWTAWRPISILPQRLLAVQIAVTYLGVGWQKLGLPDWQSGEVLAVGFVGRWATPPAWWVARLNLPMWVYDRMVDIVKYFEFLMPIGLWIPRWQWWFFAGGAIFHTVITIFLGIWWFQALIPAYVLFLRPEDVHAFLRRVSRGRIT